MTRPDLEEERDALLARLRSLDDEFAAGEIDETDFTNLREGYLTQAAAILRQLDSGDDGDAAEPAVAVESATPVPEGDRPVRRKPRGRLVAGVLILAVVAGGSGFALASSANDRTGTAQVSGTLPEGSTDRITRAQVLVSEGKVLEAVRVYDDLLKDDPENPVALAQRGWILSRVDPKLVDSGLAGIERAIAIDPQYPEAHFFRGMILWRAKREPALAVESFQRALDAKPPADVVASIEAVKAQAQADADTPG